MLLDFVNDILLPALLLSLPLLVVFMIVLIRQLANVQRAKLNERQLSILEWLISTGVWAAEQAYKSGVIPAELREEYVVRFIQGEADKYHLVIDVQQLVIRIKAAVGRELNRDKLLGTPVGLITTVSEQMTLQAAKHAKPSA